MRIGVLRTFGLALLLAWLACTSSVSGQEPKAPAPESLDWLRGQAEKGNPAAQSILGFNCAHGQGVPQDYVEAVRWFRKAGDQGNPVAQYYVGAIYESGQVVTQDYVEALMWIDLAASRGSGDYQKIYADEREKLAAGMPPSRSPRRSAGRGSGSLRSNGIQTCRIENERRRSTNVNEA